MTYEIIIATNNKSEFNDLCYIKDKYYPKNNIKFVALPIDVPPPIGKHMCAEKTARRQAVHYSKKLNKPVLCSADELVIDSEGIYARTYMHLSSAGKDISCSASKQGSILFNELPMNRQNVGKVFVPNGTHRAIGKMLQAKRCDVEFSSRTECFLILVRLMIDRHDVKQEEDVEAFRKALSGD